MEDGSDMALFFFFEFHDEILEVILFRSHVLKVDVMHHVLRQDEKWFAV